MGFIGFIAHPFGISTALREYQAWLAHEVLKDFYLNGAIIYVMTMLYMVGIVEGYLGILDQILYQMAKFNVRVQSWTFGVRMIQSIDMHTQNLLGVS